MDGSAMSLPGDEFHAWLTGHPAGQNCAVMTNYKYWDVVKAMFMYVLLGNDTFPVPPSTFYGVLGG